MSVLGSQLSAKDWHYTNSQKSDSRAPGSERGKLGITIGSRLELELRGCSAGLTGEKPGFSTAHNGVVLCAWDPST